MFAPVLDRFAALHRVIVPDLRGHGRSRALAPPSTARLLAAELGYSQGGVIDAVDLYSLQASREASNSTRMRCPMEVVQRWPGKVQDSRAPYVGVRDSRKGIWSAPTPTPQTEPYADVATS
jgi:hypothetical protein